MDENLKNLLDTDIGKIAEDGKKKSKRRKTVLIAVTAVTVFAIAIWTVVIPRVKMASAFELLADGKYEEARAMFEGKPDMLKECDYQWYKQQLEQGNCSTDVLNGFEELGDYKDSTELIKEAKYQRAIQFMNDGEYYSAYRLFDLVGDYKDEADNATEMKYLYAKQKIEAGEYISAKNFLTALGDYKDSVELLKKCG